MGAQSFLNWYALYVKSRHEFMVDGELKNKGVDAYLPKVKKLRQWKDRKKMVDFPLFPGYMFVHIKNQPEEFMNVLKTSGAVTLISSRPGYPTPVPEPEISSLMRLMECGEEIDIYPHLKPGARVLVKRGPLAGAEGILNKKKDQYSFLVNIEILGRSVGVRIYADDVETI